MHALFQRLKSGRVIFTDPTSRLTGGTAVVWPALPLDTDWCAAVLGRLGRPDQR
jgi:hypothetical protein